MCWTSNSPALAVPGGQRKYLCLVVEMCELVGWSVRVFVNLEALHFGHDTSCAASYRMVEPQLLHTHPCTHLVPDRLNSRMMATAGSTIFSRGSMFCGWLFLCARVCVEQDVKSWAAAWRGVASCAMLITHLQWAWEEHNSVC